MEKVNTQGKEMCPSLFVYILKMLRKRCMAERPGLEAGHPGSQVMVVSPGSPRCGTLSIGNTSFPICKMLRLS